MCVQKWDTRLGTHPDRSLRTGVIENTWFSPKTHPVEKIEGDFFFQKLLHCIQ